MNAARAAAELAPQLLLRHRVLRDADLVLDPAQELAALGLVGHVLRELLVVLRQVCWRLADHGSQIFLSISGLVGDEDGNRLRVGSGLEAAIVEMKE